MPAKMPVPRPDMKSTMWRSILGDSHFWVPLVVLAVGVFLLLALH